MPLVPVYDTATKQIYVDNPWDSCGHPQFRTIFVLSNPQPGTGIPIVATGMDIKGNQIVITATSFTGLNEPKSTSFNSSFGGVPNAAGTGMLVDTNSDGFFDAGSATGTLGPFIGTMQFDFVYFDVNGDGIFDYISLPWTPANLFFLGINTADSCGPGGLDPQIFIPLANGRIILDLDGNGLPDPGVFQSPPLAPAVTVPAAVIVPTLSPPATLLLALGLVIVAWFALRRGGLGV